MAIATNDRKDDVRLSGALAKLLEEDPTLELAHDPEHHQTLLRGQGDGAPEGGPGAAEAPLRRRRRRRAPEDRLPETIRKKTVTQRGRHKKQSGGHGQFGDVVLEIGPRRRGEGFVFSDKITGGVVPKQWIPGGRRRGEGRHWRRARWASRWSTSSAY